MSRFPAVLLLLLAWVGCAGGTETAPPTQPAQTPAKQAPVPSEGKAMPSQSFRFSATFTENIPAQPPGKVFEVPVKLKNTSTEPWPGDVLAPSNKPLCAAYHLYSPGGEQTLREGIRTMITSSVQPGEEITLVLRVKAPDASGKYLLEPDIVQERVVWFSLSMKDSPPPRLAFEVKAAQ